MPARGIQHLPIRYPREAPAWFATFMDGFIRDVLVNLDVRNAIPGPGIQIEGMSDRPATLSTSEDLQQLMDENYILAEESAFLANARVLTGENGVVSITDEGPGGSFVISLVQGGIPYAKLADLDELSVLGNPSHEFGSLTRISGSAEHDVLSVQSNGANLEVRFGAITHQSVSDFNEAAQDAVGAALTDTNTINLTYVDGTPAMYADALYQMSITADAGGLKLQGDSATPGNNKVYGTDSSGNRGWQDAGSAPSSEAYNKQWVARQNGIDVLGSMALSTIGTQSTPSKGTSTFSDYIGKRRITSATTANTTATFNVGNAQDQCYAAAPIPRAAGFKFVIRFGVPSVVAGERFWCGMNGPTTGSTNPSSLTNLIGVGRDDTDTNLQVMHNDGTGSATKIDLGRTFASVAGHAFDLVLTVPLGGGSCEYLLTDLDDGTTYSGVITTNLPATDSTLSWNLWASVGATGGTAVAVDFMHALLKYPNV